MPPHVSPRYLETRRPHVLVENLALLLLRPAFPPRSGRQSGACFSGSSVLLGVLTCEVLPHGDADLLRERPAAFTGEPLELLALLCFHCRGDNDLGVVYCCSHRQNLYACQDVLAHTRVVACLVSICRLV